MMPSDTSEKGLESIIVASLVEEAGYVKGDSKDYDREHAVDLVKLLQFLAATQPDTYEILGIEEEGPKRTQFLHRLQGEIAKRGVVDYRGDRGRNRQVDRLKTKQRAVPRQKETKRNKETACRK